MLQKSIKIIEEMQYPSGLFAASGLNVKTGYNLSWIRDNVYTLIGLESAQKYNLVKKTLRALLDILLKHEYKIDFAIKEKPKHAYQYIHARYDPNTMEEIWENWGNKQNDAIGALLFKIGDLEGKGVQILRNEDDLRIVKKLVNYLESIEYWHDKDNGMWEENEEVHASSIGACVAGLKAVRHIVDVPSDLIKKGEDELNRILPSESVTKETDLALLSLIYPYNIVNKEQKRAILGNVEKLLVRKMGLIRYIGDMYYNNGSGKGGEAEWCFGFPWLAIIHKRMGNNKKYKAYLEKTFSVINKEGELPELYFADSEDHNENSPLAWGQAMLVVAVS